MVDPILAYAPPRGSSSSSPRKLLRGAAIGCTGLLVTGILAVGSCVVLAKGVQSTADRELNPVVDHYFAEVNAGNYRGAYSAFGPGMHSTTSEADYVAFDQGVHGQLGKLESKTVGAAQGGYNTQGRWAYVVYNAHFERGDASVRFNFQKENGDWKISGLHYDLPTVAKTAKLARESE